MSPFNHVQFFLFCLAMVQLGQFLTGSYLRSCLSTMERLYGFNSKKTGLLVSASDVGTLVVILFVSYLGRKVHRPRFIAVAGMLMSTAVCIFGMLYFVATPSEVAVNRAISRSGAHGKLHQLKAAPLCNNGDKHGINASSFPFDEIPKATTDNEANEADDDGNGTLYVFMFLTLVLFGVGMAPVNPLGVSYLDDAADPNRAPLYVALLFALTIVGPAFGHLIAAKALTIFTSAKGPMWNIGFFIGAATMLLAQISLWFFPRNMAKQKSLKQKAIDKSVKSDLELKSGAVNKAFDAEEGRTGARSAANGDAAKKNGGVNSQCGDNGGGGGVAANGVSLLSSSTLPNLSLPSANFNKDGAPRGNDKNQNLSSFQKSEQNGLIVAGKMEKKKEEEEKEEEEQRQKGKKEEESLEENLRKMSFIQYVKGFFEASKEIVRSPVWCLMTLMTVMLTAMIGGVISFQTKYLEIQYGVSAGKASLLLGVVNIPVGIVGIISGGYIMKRRAYTLLQASRHCLVFFSIATVITVATLFLGCPTRPMVGVNEYQADSSRIEVVSKCNKACDCRLDGYSPICSQDRIEFLSPCLAGCKTHNSSSNTYADCDCIPYKEARGGKCPHLCSDYLKYYMIVNSLAFLVSGLVHSPGYIIFLRSVKPKHKSLAIGLQYLFIRAIGKFPSPILFGAVVDSTCLLWSNGKEKDGGNLGSCLLYDSDALRVRFWGLALALKGLIVIIFIAINYILWKKEQKGESQNSHDE